VDLTDYMLDAIRILAAFGLAIIAYRHASLWGRFFMNLHGMKSPAEVSPAYYRPATRFASFYVPQLVLIVAIWLLWPYGQWGLTTVLVSAWGFKVGMRCELLRAFVRQLLLQMERGTTLECAWPAAETTIKAVTGIRNPNFNRHAAAPAALVRYVVSTARSKNEASEIMERWSRLVTSTSA
jgi:hypothetical protein